MANEHFAGFTKVLEYIIKYFKLAMGFAIGLMLLSGIYIVDSHEVAIVLRFGRIVGDTPSSQIREPGLHFAIPFFVDQVIRVPVHTIHELEITTHHPIGMGSSGFIVTGDNNIALLRAVVRYQISDPASYALLNHDVGSHINGVVSGVFTSTITQMEIDHVLTTGRGELGVNILNNSQILLNQLGMGVTLTSVEITDITPPIETAHYFDAVRSAAIIRETNIQHALETAQILMLNAQALASETKQNAILEQTRRLTTVHSHMAEFNGLYDQYQIDPQIIYSGVFRQRVTAVVSQAGQSIIIPDDNIPPTIILP